MTTPIVRPITLADVAGYNAGVGVVALERKYLLATEPFPLDRSEAFVKANLESGAPHFCWTTTAWSLAGAISSQTSVR